MAKKRSYAFWEMSFMDVQEILKETDVVMVPIGSCEKHGAHIPLATDSIVTIVVVERTAKVAGVPYTPLIPIGYSPHHMGEVGQGVGTLSFSGETLRRIIYEIGKCLVFHGFNKIIYVSQHGSNSKVVDEVLRRLRYETGCFTAWYKTPTERQTTVLEGLLEEKIAWHSGEMETAQMMAYDESVVDMSVAVKDAAHAPKLLGPQFMKTDGVPTVSFQGSENIWVPMEHHEYADQATIGDPFLGTKEKGERIYARIVKHLADFLEEIKRVKVEIKTRDHDFRAW